jgi:cation transport regulator ChaC
MISNNCGSRKIFAYGSLMNSRDLMRTVPEARNMIPVKLYGYKRVFNLESTYRFDPLTNIPICVLNIESSYSLDFVNGICFDMDYQSFDDLLEREKAYDLIEAVVYEYFDDSKNYEAYFFVSKDSEKYPYRLESDLQLDYLEICIEGCSDYGQEFLEDFKRSTHFFGVDSDKYENLIWNRLKYFNNSKSGHSSEVICKFENA